MSVLEQSQPRPSARSRLRAVGQIYVPNPPDDKEKYSYLGKQRRWPFVWLFVSQSILISAFTLVMIHNPVTAVGLIFLTFMVPPAIVNFWLRMRKRRINLEDHSQFVQVWRETRSSHATVDVFIPCCGEDGTVLANTYSWVRQLEWPGRVRVYVLDDADDATTKRLAEASGFNYVVRSNRGEWKKAGNLINAFDTTDGEFIVVFDADFAPRTDFLWETIPYMDDPRTGVVQTAQYFDVDRRVNEFAKFAGTLQELFFRWIQPARDTYEAAICAGTNVVYRRAAVVAAGGFAKVPLGEDVHSGVKIWVANFRTRYIPLVLAKGVAPDTWAALTNQQYRWCRSSMLLMVSTFFRDAPFGLRQRICFWAAFLYYMSSAAILITASLPTIIMLWGYPAEIHPRNYIAVIPAVLSTFVVFPALARGWNISIIRVCMINSFCHALAVFDALRNRVQAWVPTGAVPKKKSRFGVPERIAIIGRVWFVVTQTLLWGGLAHFLLIGLNVWDVWPAIVLAGVQLVFLAPLLVRLAPARRRLKHDMPSERPHLVITEAA
jgi:cellulose synthase (UDP-forming)